MGEKCADVRSCTSGRLTRRLGARLERATNGNSVTFVSLIIYPQTTGQIHFQPSSYLPSAHNALDFPSMLIGTP